MISSVLATLQDGLRAVRLSPQLTFIAVLVFIFPIAFIWVNQSFFTTAYNNINTAQKQRVGILHDSLATMLVTAEQPAEMLQVAAQDIAEANQDITKIRVVQQDDDGLRVIAANDATLLGSYEDSELYTLVPLSANTDTSIIFTPVIDGVRTWQVFRRVSHETFDYYIFSEHSFATIDGVMTYRRQQSYIALTLIFLFLISLAYWVRKQEDWQRNHSNLQHQLQERDLFSNMIAHEFRSPLTAIKGYASFLTESKALSVEERRFAHNIKDAADRLVFLVNDFLEVARLQSGKLSIEVSNIDLREVLTRVSEDLSSLATEKGLTLHYTPCERPITMQTDPARMTQVITNIVSNAIKYTERGQVELEAIAKPGEVTVLVKDTGMGISAEDQKKLFAPFTRVGGVDKTETTGTGLGMWITKQLTALLGGTIGVESIKGVGTHIVISFRV